LLLAAVRVLDQHQQRVQAVGAAVLVVFVEISGHQYLLLLQLTQSLLVGAELPPALRPQVVVRHPHLTAYQLLAAAAAVVAMARLGVPAVVLALLVALVLGQRVKDLLVALDILAL
jgi:hypothetical protein